jgi:hypothetical protein
MGPGWAAHTRNRYQDTPSSGRSKPKISVATASSKGLTAWCQQLPKIVDNSRQSRSRRPGSARRVSVPSAFRHVISPGVARKVSRVGPSPLGPALAPPRSHVCSFADGPGLPVFAGLPLWQASPPRPVAGEGVCVTSAAWCGLRRRLFLRLPMPLAIERAMHIYRGVKVSISFVVTHWTPEQFSPLRCDAFATKVR